MKKYDSAVSPLIAVILIMALTIILAAIAGVAVLSSSGINTPAPVLGVTITENNGYVTFTHYSGETLKAGEYEIILDSKTIPGNTDFGPGSILTYEAENINHAEIVYIGNKGNSIIAEKYFGGSGLPIYNVDTEIIGFRTSSILSDDGKEITDGDNKYKLIYGTESKIGVIIELSGEYLGNVLELTDVVIKDAGITELIDKSEGKYECLVPVEYGGKTYDVSGTVKFDDGTSQNIAENVYIPSEAELTFEIGTYAKYIDGVFNKEGNTNIYEGHGIYIKLTGGSEANLVNGYSEILLSVIDKDGKTISMSSNIIAGGTGHQIEYNSGISDAITDNNYIDKKLYYYINSANTDWRFEFKLSEVKIKVSLSDGSSKEITLGSDDFKDKIIPPWSPLYEQDWYSQPNGEIKPFDTVIEPYNEGNIRGIKITVSNGYFPDFKHSDGSGKIFPVIMDVTIKDGDNTLSYSSSKLLNSISNGDYYLNIGEYNDGAKIDDCDVSVKYTMTDDAHKDTNKEFIISKENIVIESINIENECLISVDVKGYQKFVSGYLEDKTGYENYRGHGIILTANINESTIDKNYVYMLGISFNNNGNNYPLTLNSIPKFITGEFEFGVPSGRIFNNLDDNVITGDYYYKVAQSGKHVGGSSTITSYLQIGNLYDNINNLAFENPKIKIDLYKYSKSTGLMFIRTVYDSSEVQIPARDLLLENYTIYGVNNGDKRGIHLNLYADLSSGDELSGIGNKISVSYKMDGNEHSFIETLGGYGSEYDFLADSSTAKIVTDIQIKIGDLNIPIYDEETATKPEGESKKTTQINIP